MIRAYVSDHDFGWNVRVGLILHLDHEHPHLIRFTDSGVSTVDYTDIEHGAQIPPSLVMSQDEARALYQGLQRHFAGAEDDRQLRKDYAAERDRVDQLLATMSTIATQQVLRGPHG